MPQQALLQLTSTEQAITWLRSRVAAPLPGALRTDSRRVLPGDIFLAWPGATHDGRQHVQAALRSGAVACLIEAEGAEGFDLPTEGVAALPGLKAAAGAIAHAWAGKPSQALRVLAVTGTNGKTSTSWWLAQALSALGTRCAVVGTLGVGELVRAGGVATAHQDLQATGLTTPDAVLLQACLRALLDSGVQACAMEASSIGIQEHRLSGLQIEVALFTNLTQDHLDYHHSMAAYWAAKQRLFQWPGLRSAVVNVDDAHGVHLASRLQSSGLQLWTVALDGAPARLQGLNLRYDQAGLAFEVVETGLPANGAKGAEGAQVAATPGVGITVRSPMVGRFNASNLLVVLGGLRALGVPLPAACAALAQLTPVPGRMQRVAATATAANTAPDERTHVAYSDVAVIVDYAHTPDALEQVLQSLAPLVASREGRLWCVLGCGGDRDASKRSLMGAAAARLAHQVVLTSDNPRSEDPARILQQMLVGVVSSADWQQRVVVIEDRRAAIRHAVLGAAQGDVVLLAGKGHEQTQDIAGLKLPFSDEDEARQALLARAAAAQQSVEQTAPQAEPQAMPQTVLQTAPQSAPQTAAQTATQTATKTVAPC